MLRGIFFIGAATPPIQEGKSLAPIRYRNYETWYLVSPRESEAGIRIFVQGPQRYQLEFLMYLVTPLSVASAV